MKEGKALKVGEGGVYSIAKEGGKAFAFSSATGKDMLEKVHVLQEQVAAIKAKKMDITALEESLKKLEAELKAKEEKLREFEYKLDKAPTEVTVIKKIGEDEVKGDVVVYEKIRGDEAKGKVAVWVTEGGETGKDKDKTYAYREVGKDDNTIQIVIGGKGMGREAYDRAIAKLKKELPEGYKLLESNFDEKSGGMPGMTLKIAPPEGKKSDQKLIRKLVDSLRAEIDKK